MCIEGLLSDYNILSISLSCCIDLKLLTDCANEQVLVNPTVKCIGQVLAIAVAECTIYGEELLFCLSLKRILDLRPSRVPRIHLLGRRTGWHLRSSWQWTMASMMARWMYGLLELPALNLVSNEVSVCYIISCTGLHLTCC